MTRDEQWQLTGSAAERYERVIVGGFLRRLAERFLEDVPLRPGDRVLDVACGTGVVARLAAPRVGRSGSVVGLDLNEGMLAIAGRHAGDGAAIRWQQGDAAALPFGAAEFDVVLCQQGLQFFPDRARALQEMRRVVVPGGMVALNVFGRPSRLNTALAEGLARNLDAGVARVSLAPFALGDPAALRATLAQGQFSSVEVRDWVLERRVEPTQEWLLEFSSAFPYGEAIAGMAAPARAALVRSIAANLREFWVGDSFAVPTDVHLVYARS
jgi:ubiquinone/menaquinone biosynthesis C-methylase UbiE